MNIWNKSFYLFQNPARILKDIEGKGIVEIGNEREKVIKDQLIFSPARIPHRLLNESEKVFRFLVIKTPTPTSETKIL
ncbi:MAG: cupin domain-containing protein [Promethearchaeota archaeon]